MSNDFIPGFIFEWERYFKTASLRALQQHLLTLENAAPTKAIKWIKKRIQEEINKQLGAKDGK